jgi:hypothetical protein
MVEARASVLPAGAVADRALVVGLTDAWVLLTEIMG